MKAQKQAGIKVAAGIKAGGFWTNHNRTLVAIRVKSGVTAGKGIFNKNHSARLLAVC